MAEAVRTLKMAGVGGPYAIALGPRCFTGLMQAMGHGGFPVLEVVKHVVDGDVVWAPGVDGAVVLSTRGGDFELVVGRDLSIGYTGHDAATGEPLRRREPDLPGARARGRGLPALSRRRRSARQLGVGALQLDGLPVRDLLQLGAEVGDAVGMVALELLAVGAHDLVARGAARDAEHGVRVPALRGASRRAPRCRRRAARRTHAQHQRRRRRAGGERAITAAGPAGSARSRKRKNSLFGDRISVVPLASAVRYASSVRWKA